MSTDPCDCDVLCPHGDRCLGGHANWPDGHWWPCEVCSPPAAAGYRLVQPEGQVLMVMSGCRHALGPGRMADLSWEMAQHARTCRERGKR